MLYTYFLRCRNQLIWGKLVSRKEVQHGGYELSGGLPHHLSHTSNGADPPLRADLSGWRNLPPGTSARQQGRPPLQELISVAGGLSCSELFGETLSLQA